MGDTIIASSGSDSAYLGQLDVAQGERHMDGCRTTYCNPSTPLLRVMRPCRAKVDEFKALADEYLADYGYTYDQVIAYSPYQYTNINDMYANPDDYALGDIIVDAYMYAVEQAGAPTPDVAVAANGYHPRHHQPRRHHRRRRLQNTLTRHRAGRTHGLPADFGVPLRLGAQKRL